MRRYRRQLLQGAVLAFAIFILLIALADVRQLIETLRGFPVWLLLPILLLKLVNYVFRYLQWHYLLGLVGVQVKAGQPSAPGILNLQESIATFLAGFPMAISPGKAAEVLKCAIVKHRTGVPIAQTAPVVLAERLIDGLAVLVIIGVAGLTASEEVFKAVDGIPAAYVQGIIAFTYIVMAVGIGILHIKPLMHRLLNLMHYIPLVRRVQPWCAAFYESSYQILHVKRLLPTITFGLIAYGTDCLGIYLMLRGLGMTASWLMLAQVSFILGFVVIVAALSAMPVGAGARELSLTALLIGLVGTSEGVAAATTTLNTFFQVGLGLLVGTGAIVLYHKRLLPTDQELKETLTPLEHAPQIGA